MKTTLPAVLSSLLILSGSIAFAQKPVSTFTQMLNHESKLNKARPTESWAANSQNYRWDFFGEAWDHETNTAYSYDTQGNIIEELRTDPSTNDNISRVVRVFDDQNNEIEMRSENWTNGSWQMFFGNKTNYTYDNEGRVLEEVYQFWNNTMWENSSKQTNTRNGDGIVTEEVYQDWDNGMWLNESKTTYTINQGVWASGIVQTWNNGSWMNTARFTDVVWHDFEKLQIESAIVESYNNGNWVPSEKYTSSFDNNGGFQEVTQGYNNGSWFDISRYTERFDNQGNLTENTNEDWTGAEWEIVFQELITYTYSPSDELLTRMRQFYDNFNHELSREDSIAYSGFFVGIEDLPELNNTSLFPNPTTADFTIKVDDQDVQALYINVSDLNGRTLISQSNLGNTAILKTDALATGVYMVTITSNDKRTTRQKLVKY